MYQKERINSIINILKENGYVTVKYLTEALHYSNATINRDLNILDGQKLISRSYGGVELLESKSVPLEFRYHKMKIAKNRIARRAADFIEDGETIFIDGSTTAESIGKFITDKKNITVYSNNMALVAYLSEYGINVVCTGGKVLEPPSMLGGEEAVIFAMKHKTDKLFFSTESTFENGIIGTSENYGLLFETALLNTGKAYYLTDHSKINAKVTKMLCDFSKITAVISDFAFSDETKEAFCETLFEEV